MFYSSKNIQTDASCTKLIVELCYNLIILTKLKSFVAFFKTKQSSCQVLNNGGHSDDGNRGRKRTFRCHS